jgi:HD superfamily phosphohydrolase
MLKGLLKVAGSIDLDNLDNIPRYGLSGGIVRAIPYHPARLAQAFRADGEKLALHSYYKKAIESWINLRKKVYRYVYSDSNLGGLLMLYRAVELAFKRGEIDISFFRYSDTQAINFLLERANPDSANLVGDAIEWRFYQRVYGSDIYGQPPQKSLKFYDGWKGRSELADIITAELKINPADVAVYTGPDKSVRKIDLPFWNELNGFLPPPNVDGADRYLVRVYLNPKVCDKAGQVKGLLDELIRPKN